MSGIVLLMFFFFPFLSVGGAAHSPQRSSQFLPARVLSSEGKSKGFSFISDRRRSTKTQLPRETHEETAYTLPQISDLAEAENSRRVFVWRDEDFPHSPDAALSLNILPPRVGNLKIHFRFLLGKENTSREQKIIVLICVAHEERFKTLSVGDV